MAATGKWRDKLCSHAHRARYDRLTTPNMTKLEREAGGGGGGGGGGGSLVKCIVWVTG